MFSSKPKKDVKFEPFKSELLDALKEQEAKKNKILKQKRFAEGNVVGSQFYDEDDDLKL